MGSQLFFTKSSANFILILITLVITIVAGFILVRSVKKVDEQKDLLEIANNEKSEFMSFASHQIRTPLTSMKGFASMMLEGDYGPLTPPLKDVTQKILVSGNNVVALISQYLDKSKMELGQLKYDFVDFDLIELAKQVYSNFKPNAEQAKLELKFKANEASPCMVNADKGKMKEIIGNLIDNSIKYTPSGFVEVSVEQKDDKAIIKISDSGVGMNATTMADLFKKFSRAKDAGKTNILGSGLGLYLAKTFVEAQKGRVWAESEGEGKGSVFIVELPLKADLKD